MYLLCKTSDSFILFCWKNFMVSLQLARYSLHSLGSPCITSVSCIKQLSSRQLQLRFSDTIFCKEEIISVHLGFSLNQNCESTNKRIPYSTQIIISLDFFQDYLPSCTSLFGCHIKGVNTSKWFPQNTKETWLLKDDHFPRELMC